MPHARNAPVPLSVRGHEKIVLVDLQAGDIIAQDSLSPKHTLSTQSFAHPLASYPTKHSSDHFRRSFHQNIPASPSETSGAF
eukprot:6428027-Amphidinium_carterae.4